MATSRAAATEKVVTDSPENWEWDVVQETPAIKVVFDTIGDVFIGELIGMEHIDNEPAADGSDRSFDQWLFLLEGERYAIADSYSLGEALRKIDPGKWCRIEYVRDVPTARKLNDMKAFRVSVRK